MERGCNQEMFPGWVSTRAKENYEEKGKDPVCFSSWLLRSPLKPFQRGGECEGKGIQKKKTGERKWN